MGFFITVIICGVLGYHLNWFVTLVRRFAAMMRLIADHNEARQKAVDMLSIEELLRAIDREPAPAPAPTRGRRPNRRRKAQRLRAERQAKKIEAAPWHRRLLDEEES
jgi:hypothetical protein